MLCWCANNRLTPLNCNHVSRSLTMPTMLSSAGARMLCSRKIGDQLHGSSSPAVTAATLKINEKLHEKRHDFALKSCWSPDHDKTSCKCTMPSTSSSRWRRTNVMQVHSCGDIASILRDKVAIAQSSAHLALERKRFTGKRRSSCKGTLAHQLTISYFREEGVDETLFRRSSSRLRARDISFNGRLTEIREACCSYSCLGHYSSGHECTSCAQGPSKKPGVSEATSRCAIRIPESVRHGRNITCTAAHGEGGDELRRPPQGHRVKQEIHGRRTRAGRPAHHGPHNNIMFQAFNWESYKKTDDGKTWWQVLKSQVKELAALGVTDVWLPPVSQAVDRQGYLPSELYNLDASKYGTGVQLKELIDELHNNGICVIADIVINHRSGGLQDNKGHWNVFKGGNRDKRLDWGSWAVVDDDLYDSGGKGHHDTGESYAAAPDLDHTNKRVQDELTDWMNWMKAEIGFDGWRFDFVKGYAPGYTKLYCMRTNPTLAVGELWTSMVYDDGQLAWDQNGHRQELCNWIDGTGGTCSAFDFTTKGILQHAVDNEFWRLKDGNGKPAGLIGWWPERAVTFLDNHDTGSTQRHWPFPEKKLLMGYAYILTHPGTPCLFYDHICQYKLKGEIKKLLDLRKRHRITAVSRAIIQKAEADIYICKIDNRVILKMGPRYDMGGLLPQNDLWKMTITGPDYAIWETTAPLPPLPEPPKPLEDEKQTKPSHPTQPIHITSKMSAKTRSRILKEVPELVEPKEVPEKTKPVGSEQGHVYKKIDARISKECVEESHTYTPLGIAVTPAETTSPIHGCNDLQPTTSKTAHDRPAGIRELKIDQKIRTSESLKDSSTDQQINATKDGVAPGKIRTRGAKIPKDKAVRAEIHGQRIRPSRPNPHGPYNNILLQICTSWLRVLMCLTNRKCRRIMEARSGARLGSHRVLPYGFNWESPHKKSTDGISWWTFLKPKVKDFAELGVTDVWLPPPSDSVDKNGYLPRELYNLNSSSYGTASELKELIDELHFHGICAIADVVINHRCGREQDAVGRWNNFRGGTPDKRLDWGPWAVVDDDIYDCGGEGTHDTGEKFDGAPDLDHTNKRVQDELTDWMNWLKAEIGFDGWRFDFVKGYDPKFTAMYCARTNPTISVGEFWTDMLYYNDQLEADQNGHRQRLCNWIDGTNGASCVFDFTTKGILQHGVENELWRLQDSNGRPAGLIGWYPQRAVTFIDNHDTGSTQRHWCFPDNKVEMGYAYIITHPGIPCLFLDHLYEFNLMDKIHTLLDIRKRNRINAMSKVVIQKAESTIYVAKIDDRVILKLGSRVDMDELLPDNALWTVVATGAEYCIWEINEPLLTLPPPPLEEAKQQGYEFQPILQTQPTHLTRKISEGTRKRILEEVPELVKPEDYGKKKKKTPRPKSQ